MAQIETWLKTDLQQVVRVQELDGNLFTADNGANRIGVIVTNKGESVSLSGGVTGYIIRPDEATVVVYGSLSGNRAWVDLPASVYVKTGPFSVVLKNGNTTIGAACGFIRRSMTDTIVDPGHIVPSLAELLAQIENMRQLNQTVTQQESGRVTAESGRVTAEQGRASAETARAQAETVRAAAEAERDSAESARATAEVNRGNAETGRANAETARVNAETARANAETTRANAETSRAAAESERADAETARANAETSRANAESARDNAETVRANAETARAQAESVRDTAETARADAESTRDSAESARIAAETARASAESTRDDAESARVTAETARANAETARAGAESGRVTAEAARASAEAARVQAETARDTAETARASAETSRAAAETQRVNDFEAMMSAAEAATNDAEDAADMIENITVAANGLAPGSAPTATVTIVDGHLHIVFGSVKGDPGKDFEIRKTFTSIAQMEAYDPETDPSGKKVRENDFVMIDTGSVQDVDTGKLFCYEPDTIDVWRYIGDLSGSQGIKGETGTGIDHVTLNADYTLTVYYDDGTSDTTTSIRGATGATPNISIGTVVTLQPNQNAYVQLDQSSTPEAPVFNFGIPQGETGQVENVYGSTIPMSPSDSTKVKEAIDGKLAADQGSANAGKYMKVGNDGTLTPETLDIGSKADKVQNATANNFAGLDANGNLKDSGKKAADFVAANQGADNFGKALGIDNTGAVVPVPFSGEDFTGATAQSNGTHGYVPAPASGDQDKFLRGDGTWGDGLSPDDIANNLTTDDTTKALSAAMGKELNNKIMMAPVCSQIDRWLRFNPTNKRGLIIKANTHIQKANGEFEHFSSDTAIDFSSQTFENGKDYGVFLKNDGSVVASLLSASAPENSVKIGRFHTLCANVGSITNMQIPASPSCGYSVGGNVLVKPYRQASDPDFWALYNKTITAVTVQGKYDLVKCHHPLSGFVAGDILPESVFCMTWFPDTLFEDAMVYEPATGIAVDIYLQSGTGLNTRSVYNATHILYREEVNHAADFFTVGKRFLDDYEFTQAALGSNERTNIAGSSDKTYVGGHVDTANRRMISAIGCEEMCGYLFQWIHEFGGMGGSSFKAYDLHASFGQNFGNIPYVLWAGGGFADGDCAGSRSRLSADGRSSTSDYCSGRGSSRVKRGF